MTVALGATGLVVQGRGAWPSAARAVDVILRGVGQVMLQDNAWAGLLFCVAIFWNSPLFGAAALLGTAAGTVTARVLSFDRAQLRAGVHGFNGALTGVALLYFLQPDALTWIAVAFAAACTSVLLEAVSAVVRRWKLKPLTVPFVLVSWCVFLAAARFGRLHATSLLPAAGLPHGIAVEGVVGLSTLSEGLFKGVAEVFFQDNLVSGVLFTLGLLVASRRAALAALFGSSCGLLVAWAMGAAEPAIRAGAYGFNGVLVAIALVSVLDCGRRRGVTCMVLAVIAAPVVYAGLSAALQPFGIPTLTLPFVLVTWTFVLAARAGCVPAARVSGS